MKPQAVVLAYLIKFYEDVKYQNGNVLVKTKRRVMEATLQGKRFMSNTYLHRFNCPLSNDCSLVTYANGRVSAVLTY